MGRGFRRSVSFGGVRFTFSKSGVSTSWGTKHFRFTAGPRGTYVTSHFGGFYYRARVDGAKPNAVPGDDRPARPTPRPAEPDDERATYYSVGDLPRLTDTTQADFVRELNGATSPRWRAQLVAAAIIAVAALVLGNLTLDPSRVLEVSAYALILLAWARNSDNRGRRYILMYDLERPAEERWARMRDTVLDVGRSDYLQSVRSEHYHGDRRRHGGATSGVTSLRAHIVPRLPRFVLSNIVPVEIQSHDAVYYLFPDRLLVKSGWSGTFAAASYSSLEVRHTPVAFTWNTGSPPDDAEILHETWRYVRNDGGPDRRFNNNVRLPVLALAELGISGGTGLRFVLLASRTSAVRQAVDALGSYGRASRDVDAEVPLREHNPAIHAALATLGLSVIPSADELKRMYRELATRNHPDRFASASPAIRLMATARMQEINQAYRLLLAKAPVSAPEPAVVEPPEQSEESVDSSVFAPERNRTWIVALSVACVAFVGMRLVARIEPPSLPIQDQSTTEPRDISISVTGIPRGVTVRIDGRVVSLPISVTRDSAEHRIEISAPGYIAYRATFSADRDIALAVSLARDEKERTKRRRQKQLLNEVVEASPPPEAEASSHEPPAVESATHSTDRPADEHAAGEDPWADEQNSDSRSAKQAKEPPPVKETDETAPRTSPSETPKAAAWKDPFAE